MKTQAILLAILMLAAPAFAIKASVIDYDPLPAKAGQYVDVFISIENNSKADTKPVTVELVPKDSIRLAFNEPAQKILGIIPGNKATVVQYRLQITADAVDGSNRFEVDVRESTRPDEKFELSIDVDNKVPNIEIGSVISEPKKILPDTDDVKLTATILNTGNRAAQNVKAVLELPEQLETSESFSDQALIGNIAEDSSATATYFIDVPEGTRGGNYQAKLQVQYTLEGAQDNEVLKKEIIFDIPVKPAPRLVIVSAKATPEELASGQNDVQLLLTVKNEGDADAESVRVKVFQKSEQPFTFDKEFDFVSPKLAPGQSGQATLEFNVKESAAVQDYFLDIELKSTLEDDVIINKDVAKITVANAKASGPDFLIVGIGALVVVGIIAAYYYRRFATISKSKEKQNK